MPTLTSPLAPLAAAIAAALSFAPAAAQQPLDAARALVAAHVPETDDSDLVARRLLEAATALGKSPIAAPLVARVAHELDDVRDLEACLQRLGAFAGGEPHALAAHEARVLQVRILQRLGRLDEAKAIDAQLGFAERFLAIGPFGDSGDYYSGVVFAPELQFPAPGESLPGRFGPVQPRVVEREPCSTFAQLPARGREREKQGCFYALHQVDSAAAQPGYVEVRCNGSYELFVNGARAARVDRLFRRWPWVNRFPVVLAKGQNQVLIKTTLNERQGIALRYVDAAGRPLPNLREGGTDRVVPAAAPPSDLPQPAEFVDGVHALQAAARSAAGEERKWLWLAAGLAAFDGGDVDRGLAMLAELEAAPPTDPIAELGLAALTLAAEALPAEIRQSRARELVEPLAETLVDHHFVVQQRVRWMQDADQREEAVRLLQRRLAAGAAGPTELRELHELLRHLEFDAEMQRARDAWCAAAPFDEEPVLAAANARSAGGDREGALAMLVEASGRMPGELRLQRRIRELALDLGRAELAVAATARIHALRPDGADALADRAATERRLGRVEPALELEQQLVRHPEASAQQVREAGDHLLAAERREAAIGAYERALELEPGQQALRRLLGRLRDPERTEDHPDIARFRHDGEALIAAFEASAREQGAPSTLVLDQMIVQVFDDGSAVHETHQIRRINDLSGVERYQQANRAATADELVLLRTVTPDGTSWVPHKVERSFSMPRLQPGAFVEEIWREFVDSPEPGPWRALDSGGFLFQSDDEPYLLSEFVVILPPNAPGDFRARNFAGEPEVVELDGGKKAWIWRQRDVPRLRQEKRTPPLQELVPIVNWGEDDTIDPDARVDHVSLAYRTMSTPPVAAKTREVIAGVEGDAARAAAIHGFVHQAIASGQGPADPTAILLRGQGPRFFLEVAMLREAGVPLSFASTAAGREAFDDDAVSLFLGETSYQVPAVRVEPRDGQPAWLFVDAPRYTPFGMVPAARLGAPAVLLRENGYETVRVPGGEVDAVAGLAVHANVTLGDDGSAHVDAELGIRGYDGYHYADLIRNRPENVQANFARQVAGQVFRGWTLEAAKVTSLKPGTPVRIEARLVRRQALKRAGDELLLDLPLQSGNYVAAYGDRGGRELPLALHGLDATSWTVTIDPGAKHRFAGVPASVHVRHMLLDYTLDFRVGDDGKLTVRRELLQQPGTVPASQFDEWLRLLRRLDLAEEAKVELRPR